MAFLGLVAIACLVFAGYFAHRAYDERAQAGQFLAAPRCTGNATPAGDCFAWQTRTVSDVRSGKGDVKVDLDGGALHLWYVTPGLGWISGLAGGEPVSVLLWEGSAQALRDPGGHVFFSEDSVLHEGDSDIGGTVFLTGFALVMMTGVFASSPWSKRRGSRYVPLAVVLFDAGVSGCVGGAVIQGANSVDTGLKVGVIVFCAIGLAAAVVILLRWIRKLAA
jgi:hypothetical protein